MTSMNAFLTSIAMLIPLHDFHLYHSIDRELYTILLNLCRDPVESMQIMALWIWSEQQGFNNIIKKILELPTTLINDLANEAVLCLICIHNPHSLFSPETIDIPLTRNLIQWDISLPFFHENRNLVIQRLTEVGTEICMMAFRDLMEDAIARNNTQRFEGLKSQIPFQQSLANDLRIMEFQNSITNTAQNGFVPAEGRTMFVTFSRGHPVAEWEMRNYFNQTYGDCIESFYMQDLRDTDDQALFALIVFFRPEHIHMILDGENKAKFIINGKHVWMRQYMPRRPNISSSPSLPQNSLRSV